jgi:hypothetical protein
VPEQVCTNESFAVGYKELTRAEFFIDETRLNTGFIDATYDLATYDEKGGPAGDPVPTHIRADFEGEGPIDRTKVTEVYEDENFIWKFTFHGFFRLAEAHGWIDGVDIGETYDAYMSLSTSAETKRKA